MKKPYENILNSPHPTPRSRVRMSSAGRAAQFAPFAALSGHSEAINEAEQTMKEKILLDEHGEAFYD